MIKFVDDGKKLLQDIYDLTKPGGLLSITAVNPYSEVYSQAIFQGNLAAAQAAIGEDRHYHPWFGKSETRHSAENLIEFLETLGYKLLGRFGLRCIIDYLPDNEAKFEPSYFAEIEKLENALTDRYPYNLLARMFQIIVQKGMN
jgi:S-adenosylmethionine-dependent methyltransferase